MYCNKSSTKECPYSGNRINFIKKNSLVPNKLRPNFQKRYVVILMSKWEIVLKKEIYEGEGVMGKFKNKSARETYDWFMATNAGRKHPKGDIHDSNLMYIFMNHVKKAFEDDTREYQIAQRMYETSLERQKLADELYDLLSSKITSADRQIESGENSEE